MGGDTGNSMFPYFKKCVQYWNGKNWGYPETSKFHLNGNGICNLQFSHCFPCTLKLSITWVKPPTVQLPLTLQCSHLIPYMNVYVLRKEWHACLVKFIFYTVVSLRLGIPSFSHVFTMWTEFANFTPGSTLWDTSGKVSINLLDNFFLSGMFQVKH